MRRILVPALVLLAVGCETARGPLVIYDRVELGRVKRVAILPLANATEFQEVNPLVERLFITELTGLKKYELINTPEVLAALDSLGLAEDDMGNPLNLKKLGEFLKADAVIGAAVTTYSPFGTEAALLGRTTERVEKNIRPPGRPGQGKPQEGIRGQATGTPATPESLPSGTPDEFVPHPPLADGEMKSTSAPGGKSTGARPSLGILGLLVPDKVEVSRTEYQYGTVTREPAIGALVMMVSSRDGSVIYEASKLIQGDARVPESYKMTYREVLSADELRRIDFIARLVVREMLDPLRRKV